MKRVKEFNEKNLGRMRKEIEKIEKLQKQAEKIRKTLDKIKEENSWVRYRNGTETKNNTVDEKIEIEKMVQKIIYCIKN